MPKKKVQPHQVRYHGGTAWRIIIPKELCNGKRKTRFFTSKRDAEEFAASCEIDRLAFRDGLHTLSNDQKGVLMNCLKRVGGDVNLISTAVDFYLSQKPSAVRKVADLINECVTTKETTGKSSAYIDGLMATFRQFAKQFGDMEAHKVTVGQIEIWISAGGFKRLNAQGQLAIVPWKTESRRTHLKNLRTLFNFGVRRGYLISNPAEKVERPSAETAPPALFTVEECEKILRWLEANDRGLIRYVVVQLFGGLRAAEAKRVILDTERDHIDVSAVNSKTKQRRLVPINRTLKAWLAVSNSRGLSTTTQNLRKRMEALSAGSGVKWQRNALRHSFVSYSYALHGATVTAIQAGHSEQVLFSNYRELVTPEEATKFWQILPTLS